jgi:TATA-box binding protein (TBP) (component of TFIID and TFIIIB)
MRLSRVFGVASRPGRRFINIENVVATATLHQNIDLNSIVRIFPGVEYRPEQFPGLVYHLRKPKTMYEPEQFPGLIYRMDDPKVVILIFSSGKLVCTGGKKETDVHRAVAKLQETLEEKGLITY